jgi:Ran GTPase-activating protein (RanGAP) involved in mRNA processing and transport
VSVGLQLNPTLLRLDLSWNGIGDSGAAAIAEALKVNSNLQKLILFSNEVGSSGAAAIARALMRHSTLRQLICATTKLEMLVSRLERNHSNVHF